jgi:integrase
VETRTVRQANLIVFPREGANDKVYWDARWRYRRDDTEPWRLIQRRIGLAWQEQDEAGGWRKRRGRCPDGWLDERAANVAAVAAMDAHEGLTPRNVNKHRQVLAAIFGYACRADTYGLVVNPVAGTDKRREDPPAALDYYEVHEVEALARCCESGSHHTRAPATDPHEIDARRWEDHRDADFFRLLFYTGLRLGEALALRIGSVDLEARLLLVRAGVSAGQESSPKGRRHRFVPLSTPAQQALARLLDRDEFTSPDDYVIVNRLGRRLDSSALRRRYKNACAQAGLRPVRLHGLRHAAGSLVARTNDPVFVRDFLGHYAGDPVKSGRFGGMRARRRGSGRSIPQRAAWSRRSGSARSGSGR